MMVIVCIMVHRIGVSLSWYRSLTVYIICNHDFMLSFEMDPFFETVYLLIFVLFDQVNCHKSLDYAWGFITTHISFPNEPNQMNF